MITAAHGFSGTATTAVNVARILAVIDIVVAIVFIVVARRPFNGQFFQAWSQQRCATMHVDVPKDRRVASASSSANLRKSPDSMIGLRLIYL